jgi:hypothetical protein
MGLWVRGVVHCLNEISLEVVVCWSRDEVLNEVDKRWNSGA